MKRVYTLIFPLLLAVLSAELVSPAFAVKGSYPGRNGKIAFDAPDTEEPYDEEIFVMNGDGTDVQQLTHNEVHDYSPCWSPDGSKMAFTRHVACGDGECLRIFVMNADGTGQTQLTVEASEPRPDVYHYRPAWSPDGTKIAFKYFSIGGGVSGIYVTSASVQGSGVLLIPDGDDPSWSPSGSKIAFSGGDNVMVADANTGTVIVTLPSGDFPCWSPDGTKIAYEDGEGIKVVKADGSGLPVSLTDFGSEPNWSPDGTMIVFNTGWNSIWIMKADGSERRDLTPGMKEAVSPDWQRLPIAPAPVGGFIEPANKLTILAPWLAIVGSVAAISVLTVKSRKKTES